MARALEPSIGAIIAGWASGKTVKMWSGEGWLVITPDNLHGMTEEKEWVTLREAIAHYDARKAEDDVPAP